MLDQQKIEHISSENLLELFHYSCACHLLSIDGTEVIWFFISDSYVATWKLTILTQTSCFHFRHLYLQKATTRNSSFQTTFFKSILRSSFFQLEYYITGLNSLPQSVVDALSLSDFKILLDKHLFWLTIWFCVVY